MTSPEVVTHQMIALKLTGMRETHLVRAKQAREGDLNCEDFFGLMLQDELEFRRGARIKRLLKKPHSANLHRLRISI